MDIGVIAPTINTCVWNIQWKEITEPVDTVHNPGFFPVSIKSMDCHNTVMKPMSDFCDSKPNVTYSRTGSIPSARTVSP